MRQKARSDHENEKKMNPVLELQGTADTDQELLFVFHCRNHRLKNQTIQVFVCGYVQPLADPERPPFRPCAQSIRLLYQHDNTKLAA